MKKPLILLAVPALFFLGCKPKPAASSNPGGTTPPPKPKACFSVNKTLIDSGETISTTNCSTNAASYFWNFGLGLQSSSTAASPTFAYKDTLGYTPPVRGTAYKVDLKAFNTAGNVNDETYSYVTVGYRQLDSVIVSNVPGFVPDGTTQFEVQLGPASNSSQYTSPPKAPAASSGGPWSCTVNLMSDNIKISAANKNESAWSGKIINTVSPPHTYTIFQNLASGQPIYFSKGVNVSPIVVKDHNNPPFELDFYYSIVAK